MFYIPGQEIFRNRNAGLQEQYDCFLTLLDHAKICRVLLASMFLSPLPGDFPAAERMAFRNNMIVS
jgi:hypothetical protein